MILHAYVDVYVFCVCIVGHGYTTARIDMGAMAMKVYYVFPKSPALQKPHHKDTRWLESLQRHSQCILLPQPIGPDRFGIK